MSQGIAALTIRSGEGGARTTGGTNLSMPALARRNT